MKIRSRYTINNKGVWIGRKKSESLSHFRKEVGFYITEYPHFFEYFGISSITQIEKKYIASLIQRTFEKEVGRAVAMNCSKYQYWFFEQLSEEQSGEMLIDFMESFGGNQYETVVKQLSEQGCKEDTTDEILNEAARVVWLRNNVPDFKEILEEQKKLFVDSLIIDFLKGNDQIMPRLVEKHAEREKVALKYNKSIKGYSTDKNNAGVIIVDKFIHNTDLDPVIDKKQEQAAHQKYSIKGYYIKNNNVTTVDRCSQEKIPDPLSNCWHMAESAGNSREVGLSDASSMCNSLLQCIRDVTEALATIEDGLNINSDRLIQISNDPSPDNKKYYAQLLQIEQEIEATRESYLYLQAAKEEMMAAVGIMRSVKICGGSSVACEKKRVEMEGCCKTAEQLAYVIERLEKTIEYTERLLKMI